MRRILLRVVVCCCALLGAAARAWPHSEEAGVCLRTYTPVEIDGKLTEWVRRLESSDWAGRMEVKKGHVLEWVRAAPVYINTITSKVEAGTITDARDLSGTVYTLWNDQHLFLAALITDNDIVTEHDGADIWQDDAVELWIDCRHDALTHTLTQDDEYQLGFSPASSPRGHAVAQAWRNPNPDPVTSSIQIASELTEQGYVLEVAVPWRVLQGCHPEIGGMIGFNMSIVDKDKDQLWSHVTWSGRLHSDPSQFGHLYFMDAPIDLFPSDVFEAQPAPLQP